MRILLLFLTFTFAEMTVKNLDPIIYFYKTHIEGLQAKENAAQARLETIELEKKLAQLEARTAKYTITHDQKLRTNTVVATLDASTSFDAGNAAEYHFVTVPVYNKDKPICVKWEDGCDDSKSDLFEELYCECDEYLEDDCGDRVYEQACEIYKEDCIDEDDCDCVKPATWTIDYVDACEYLKLDHEGRRAYVASNVINAIYDELSYSWEQLNGPAMEDQELFEGFKNSALLKVRLSQGDYRFRCTVTDPYQYKTSLTKDVKVIAEPNNAPEVQILTMDVATANYINALTAGKGRIITLKCPWIESRDWVDSTIPESCEPPTRPKGWNELALSKEITSVARTSIKTSGNSIRYCIEEEE